MSAHVLFGVHVALAWFFALNILVTLGVVAAFRLVRRSLARSESPSVPLLWRLTPFITSTFVVVAVVIPAYIALEPRGTRESAGWVSIVLATGAVAIIVAAISRGFCAVRRTSAGLRAITEGARPVTLEDSPLPAYVVPGAGALMVLAGVTRPRLYVSSGILDVLTTEELRLAVAHEVAHQRASDNTKRQLLACAPDVFGWTSAADELAREWRFRAEVSADRAAAAGHPGNAAQLASAIMKVARLAAGAGPVEATTSRLHDGHPIAHRVHLLLSAPLERAPAPGGGALDWVRLILPVILVLSATVPAHRLAHRLTELLVHLP